MWQQDGRYAGCSRSPSPPTRDLGAPSVCSCTAVVSPPHTYTHTDIRCTSTTIHTSRSIFNVLEPPVGECWSLQYWNWSFRSMFFFFLLRGVHFLCSIFLFKQQLKRLHYPSNFSRSPDNSSTHLKATKTWQVSELLFYAAVTLISAFKSAVGVS